MSYEKQNFTDGQTLYASHLNHIEEGISQLSSEIENISDKLEDVGLATELDVELSAEELSELDATISTLQSLKKSNTSVIAFLTDLHMAGWTAGKSKKAVAGYNKISSSVKTDLLLLGGDYLENSPSTTKEQALTWYSDLRDVISYCNNKAPIAVIKGNHDDNTMYTDYMNGLVDFETFWDAIGNIDEDRTIRNAGNIEDCYGYYDIPNQKIRVFYLNTVDIPQRLIEVTNTLNYRAQWDTGISIEQLQFIADNLKFDTSGWHVLVCSHHPLMYNIALENACGVKADRGGSALLELLDKFNTTNDAGSISVTGKDFEGTVNYDFSSNQDCKLIACVNGHTHRDGVDIYNDSFYCISTRAVNGHPSHEGHISSSAYFVVDRNDCKLHLIYNGDGEENIFNYDTLNEEEDGGDSGKVTYDEIASPFEWQIGTLNDNTGALEVDSKKMRISSTETIGFTTPAIIDMSDYSAYYQLYWYDTDGEYIGTDKTWISSLTPLEIPIDKTFRLKIRHNNYELWDDAKINTFASAINVYVEEGGKAYFANGSVNPDDGMVEIDNPFTFTIHTVNESTGALELEDSKMRIASQIVKFTKPATVDMSAFESIDKAWYAIYWYDTDGNYMGEASDSWQSMTTVLNVPTDKAVRIKVRYDNYDSWEKNNKISQLESAIKVYAEEGGEAYEVELYEAPISVVGEPLTNVTYRIGAGATSSNSAGGNSARMMATQPKGVKPYPDYAWLWNEKAYPITVPENATKITVTCPNFIYGLIFATYENDAYTVVNDIGWQTLGGGEYSFEAGAYGYVHINFKNSSNSAIPTDTDTSGFSIMFE